ncbi:MAG: 2-hydroxyacyl-CoA dehydratase family protein [Candidatus Limivicinus sp.]|nr:2-hydroxyacyl-CoA dehydratase family protein [Clostridiales bacterium]MDY3860394.1 2-hydroxyacyl-CoA dehydratase family protein [Candidatus Limivicinus sp.]
MAKKEKIKYPNPEFFRCKDEIDWKAQWENLKEFGGIAWDLLKATDWKKFGQDRIEDAKADAARVKDEFEAFMALDTENKKDVILHGERRLGRLYRKGAMATVRREWRGIKDTAYDFYEWARMWAMLLGTFSKDLIPALNSTLHYRWMVSYFCCHGFMDKNIMGLRGSNLRMSHLLIYDVFRYVAENLVLSAKCDKKNGNCEALNQRTVLFDEMTMGQIMAGFPDLYGFPHQLLAVFLVSEIDQLTCVPYIDAVESFGLPADCCPVPSSECGALVIDALPHMGACFLSSSMPCDGSTMASSYYSRRFPNVPVFHLCFPVRYLDEETVQMGAEDIKACIKFIEEKTGAKWNWDAYFTQIKRFNKETEYELQKWEVNKSAYPQLLGPCYELFRKWNYEMDGGADPRTIKTFEKVSKILMKAYENKEEPWPGKMKYRALVWSCPAHYYANFSNWAANCWGINVLVEMESLNFTKPLETEDKEEAMRDLARLYERMVMRRHTNGGYQNVVDELWRQCEDWNAKLVIMYQNVACKNMATVQGILDDQGRERGYDLIWVEHDLMDPRTVSRRTMRDKVSEYMRTVMKAEPVDPSLVEFEDEVCM